MHSTEGRAFFDPSHPLSLSGGYAWVELPVSHLQYDIHLPFATQRSFYYLAKIGAMTLNGTGNLADQIALAGLFADDLTAMILIRHTRDTSTEPPLPFDDPARSAEVHDAARERQC
jgi:hypothetical protein